MFRIRNQSFRIRIIKLKIRNFGSGSFCKLWKKSFKFWLITLTRHKWVEIFNLLNFSSIVYEIMMNLFNFQCIKIFFSKFGVKREESGSGSLAPNNFGSGRIRIRNTATNLMLFSLYGTLWSRMVLNLRSRSECCVTESVKILIWPGSGSS